MAKTTSTILLFSLLALGLLLFGCAQPAEPAAPAGDGAAVEAEQAAAPVTEEAAIPLTLEQKACDLLTKADVISVCGLALEGGTELRANGNRKYSEDYASPGSSNCDFNLPISTINPADFVELRYHILELHGSPAEDGREWMSSGSSNNYYKDIDEIPNLGDFAYKYYYGLQSLMSDGFGVSVYKDTISSNGKSFSKHLVLKTIIADVHDNPLPDNKKCDLHETIELAKLAASRVR